jgi:hypothetical protein
MGRLAAIGQFKQLRGWAQALHRDQAGDPEDDRNERNRTPPVLPESGQAVLALAPDPKDTQQHEHGRQQLAHAPHG